MDATPTTIPSKLQHHVFYVTDLKRSRDFYVKLLDLQFSARNHPDSSAAMRLVDQEMNFFSFGYHHHDLCFVQNNKLKMDNGSMLHFGLTIRDSTTFDAVRDRALYMGLKIREGRMLASARPVEKAFCVQDPDNHWIEILQETSH